MFGFSLRHLSTGEIENLLTTKLNDKLKSSSNAVHILGRAISGLGNCYMAYLVFRATYKPGQPTNICIYVYKYIYPNDVLRSTACSI